MKRHFCKRKNLPFNLEASDIIIPDICPVLNIPIIFTDGFGPRDNSPSIDRIRPKLGYVKGNIAVISFRANKIKTDATLEEIEKVANWLKNML